jgi:hypothetical protein
MSGAKVEPGSSVSKNHQHFSRPVVPVNNPLVAGLNPTNPNFHSLNRKNPSRLARKYTIDKYVNYGIYEKLGWTA